MFFFKIIFFNFIFFNIELVENLVFLFFSLKHCGLLQCFPLWFFFFLELSLLIFFFILNWLKI